MSERRTAFNRCIAEVVRFTSDTLTAPISLAKLIREEVGTKRMLVWMGVSLFTPVVWAGVSTISQNPPLGYGLSVIYWFSECGLVKELRFQGRRSNSKH